MSFTTFQNEKIPFQAIKTRSLKSRKFAIILNELAHRFCKKMAIFPSSFFLGNIGQENVFYDILERKKAFLDFKNQKFKNSKIGIFPKRLTIFQIFPKGLTHGFGPKNGHFSNFFFLGKLGQENVIYDILEQKTAFQAIKTRSSKSRKIGVFLQGLTHRFWTIMAFVATSFF